MAASQLYSYSVHHARPAFNEGGSMAAKRPTKKKTVKKGPPRKSGKKKQVKKPVTRTKPAGSARQAKKKSPRARKAGAQSGMTGRENATLASILKAGMD